MKKFGHFIVLNIFGLIAILYCLDGLYTFSYYKGIRSKQSWIRSEIFPDTLDYIIVGSSRCIHHLIPDQIFNQTQKKGLNLGYAATGPIENTLIISDAIRNCKIKEVFLEVSTEYQTNAPVLLSTINYLPFIKEVNVSDVYRNQGGDFKYFMMIPFYRYLCFDGKIGFRETFLNYLKPNADFIKTKGYVALNGSNPNLKKVNLKGSNLISTHYLRLIEKLNKQGIKIHVFTSPLYGHSDFRALNETIEDYCDLSQTIKNGKKFTDATHLNHEGAEEFTNIFIKKYFSIN
jgi:hypothetical protein